MTAIPSEAGPSGPPQSKDPRLLLTRESLQPQSQSTNRQYPLEANPHE